MKNAFVLEHGDDPCEGLVVERGRKGTGVGDWVPYMKHLFLAKWIEGTRAMRGRWPQRAYVDLFCGPGRIQVEDEPFTRHGGAVIAWLHSRRHAKNTFTQCIVAELQEDRVRACEARMRALGAPVTALCGPADETVHRAFDLVDKRALTLVYLDPYNLGFLSWSLIETMARLPKVDFAVHFSTSDLFRNVERDFNEQGRRFDAVAPAWRQRVDEAALYRGDADQQFFDYWCELIQSKGFIISERIPLVRAKRNAPIYHLVFFSRSPAPVRVWGDVAQGPNRELF